MKIAIVRYPTVSETQHRLFELAFVFAKFPLWHG